MEKSKSFGVWLVEGILHLLGRFPLGWHRWWGRRLGNLTGNILHYR